MLSFTVYFRKHSQAIGNDALTHRRICLRMCLQMKIIDIRSKFATIAEYLQALLTNSELLQVILHQLTNIDQFRKRLLNFSQCCECRQSPSILVSNRKPLVTLVRHSAFATFVRHLQGVCNIRRFPFLANVLPLLPMIRMTLRISYQY